MDLGEEATSHPYIIMKPIWCYRSPDRKRSGMRWPNSGGGLYWAWLSSTRAFKPVMETQINGLTQRSQQCYNHVCVWAVSWPLASVFTSSTFNISSSSVRLWQRLLFEVSLKCQGKEVKQFREATASQRCTYNSRVFKTSLNPSEI